MSWFVIKHDCVGKFVYEIAGVRGTNWKICAADGRDEEYGMQMK